MKTYYIILVLSISLAIALFHIPSTVVSSEPINVPESMSVPTTTRHSDSKDDLVYMVKEYAKKYGVSYLDMARVIECESNWNPNIQSRHKYNAGQISRHPNWGDVGDYEKSFGLVQIHLPAHPNITEEMAKDPEFAIEFMAKNFSKGRQSMWSCY